ncbi:hypothetical protein [Pajaroellobacter abortibovis]|uniref:Uncharacterized protein n=1 Tax=Pajaroellobacter abortibovis TaxID=1882918 RepID=A0A1L6MUZ2_9BACT|nr:hypothetical protein [Pajaroellobacter abortibovis]APR99277.1 hypothetical protein BCY86_00250 [Pajaroellobacter abortibovis]
MSTSTKFSDFITAEKLDPRRILVVSHKLESLTPQDRLMKLKKRQGKKQEGGTSTEIAKPRSGRPVSLRAIHAAMHGGELKGPTKTRIVRAVNFLLEQKKKETVELKTLF